MKRALVVAVVLAAAALALSACAARQALSTATPAPIAAAAPTAAPAAPRPAAAESAASGAALGASVPFDRMVIRTASLSLEVKEVEDSLAALRELARDAGGFAVQSESHFEGERMVARMVIQVPADRFDEALQRVRKLAVKVLSESSSSQDVTEEYVDLDSQLRNLQATETQLIVVMGKAEKVEDILAVQRELTQVRGQIERIQGRMKYLERRSDLGSIEVSLSPVPVSLEEPAPEVAWDPLATALRAWNASLAFLARVAGAVVLVGVFSWWLVPPAAGAFLLWRALSRRRRPAQG